MVAGARRRPTATALARACTLLALHACAASDAGVAEGAAGHADAAAAPAADAAHVVVERATDVTLAEAIAARFAAAVDPATRLRVVHPPRAEAQLDATRTVTRIAFGSCNKHDKPQDYWRRIRARKPDVWVWLGDIVYADAPVFLK